MKHTHYFINRDRAMFEQVTTERLPDGPLTISRGNWSCTFNAVEAVIVSTTGPVDIDQLPHVHELPVVRALHVERIREMPSDVLTWVVE